MKQQPETLRKDLQQLRLLVRSEAPDARESMRYGGPIYTLNEGPILCSFTAQKNNLAFYVGRVPDEIRDEMRAAGFSLGKAVVPVIDGSYELSQVPEAFRYFGGGQHKGKVVMTVRRENAGVFEVLSLIHISEPTRPY